MLKSKNAEQFKVRGRDILEVIPGSIHKVAIVHMFLELIGLLIRNSNKVTTFIVGLLHLCTL